MTHYEEVIATIRNATSREEMAEIIVLELVGVTLAELQEDMAQFMLDLIDAIKETHAK